MKYNDPSEFFKFIIEKADINIINDSQKCLSLALDLLDSEKPYFRLLKQAFTNDVYKELIKAYNSNSETKSFFINKAIKILTDDCFINNEKAIWAIGWLAAIIYHNEWNTFTNQLSKKEEEEILWEPTKPTNLNSYIKETQNQSEEILIKYTAGSGEGIPEIEKLLEGDPDNVDLLDWLAFMYYCNKNIDKAIETYKKALSIKSDNETQHYYLANCYYLKGMMPEARKEWNEVIRLNPSSKIAKNSQERIDCLNSGF